MKRIEKIRLLKGLLQGTVQVDQLMPSAIVIQIEPEGSIITEKRTGRILSADDMRERFGRCEKIKFNVTLE